MSSTKTKLLCNISPGHREKHLIRLMRSFHLCGSEPNHWHKIFPKCGGQSQSPINIVTRKVKHNSNLTGFIFEGHEDRLNIIVENHGHSGESEVQFNSTL